MAINRANVSVGVAGLLAACGMALGQYSSNFEAPTYSPGVLTGQGGWYIPPAAQVPNSRDVDLVAYAGNQYGIAANPGGCGQMAVGVSDGTLLARAQQSINFGAGGVWEFSYDFNGSFYASAATLPAVDNLGSFSLQYSVAVPPNTTATRYFQTLMSWGATACTLPDLTPLPNNTATADKFHMAIGHDIAAPTAPAVGNFVCPTANWANLPVNHWYRVKVRWSFTTALITQASIQDLTAGTPAEVTDVSGFGWYLYGGQNSTYPLPSEIRLFGGGNSATPPPGNIAAFDNIYVSPNSTTVVPCSTGVTCYANCDSSTSPPCLNVNDFICYNNLFAIGNPAANCDGSTLIPTLNVNDFICFNNAFATGCGAGGVNNCAPRP
jgi:hypothetical protein